MADGMATIDKLAIARAFGLTMRPGQDPDVTNRGFSHQRYKPTKPRPTSA